MTRYLMLGTPALHDVCPGELVHCGPEFQRALRQHRAAPPITQPTRRHGAGVPEVSRLQSVVYRAAAQMLIGQTTTIVQIVAALVTMGVPVTNGWQ